MRVILPGLVIFGALTTLVIMGIIQGGIPELHVREVLAATDLSGEIKVQGVIHKIHSDDRPLRFDIEDKEVPGSIISVEVDDTRPDLFKVGNDVAVVGRYDTNTGQVLGDKIFTQCPSRYEGTDEYEKAMSESSVAQPGEGTPAP